MTGLAYKDIDFSFVKIRERTMAEGESFLTKWERVIKETGIRSWYCEPCAVEVRDRACPHCGKTKRQRS